MIYTYTKYPVNYDQLVDEVLGLTATGLTAGLGLLMNKLHSEDMVDGSISYSDANFSNNLIIRTNEELTVDQKAILDYIISNHVVDSDYKKLDWSRRRDILSPLFYAKAGNQLQNFSNLPLRDKLIGCVYFFVPYNVRVQIISNLQDKKNWEFLLAKTKESRETCTESMRRCAGQYIRTGDLTLAQTQQFYKDVRPHVQNFNEVNSPDLKQWLTNEVGSAYENNGFAQKSYYSTALRDDLMNIYNGNY